MRNSGRKLLYAIALCVIKVACAANFVSSVETTQIGAGQSFELRLELEGAKASNSIDLSPLAKDFIIHRNQQYSSYSNVNGRVSAQSGWVVILIPKSVGALQIPPLHVATNEGVLSSQAINMQVTQNAGKNSDTEALGISLVSNVNKAKAYVNETLIYTVKIISYKPIANIVLEDIKIPDALMEKLGEAKQYDQHYGGVHAHIIEIKYAITPLKAGKLEIPPASMNGELHAPLNPQRSARFGFFNNPFFDNVAELKPFNMQSESISIEVNPPLNNPANWLPLNKLTLTQTWDIPTDLRAGETITRKIKLSAKGGFAKQLPSVKDFMQINNTKIYASKPKFTDNFEEAANNIVGIREEEYSVVLQSDGTVTFPEITIPWWNIKSHKMETSTLPARTFNVQPAIQNAAQNVTVDYSTPEPQQVLPQAEAKPQRSIAFYIALGLFCGILLCALVFFAYRMVRKMWRKRAIQKQSFAAVIEINNVDDLRRAILHYAVKNWQIAKTVSLNRLGDALSANNYVYDLERYINLMQQINAALYADKPVDLTLLQDQWEEFKRMVHKSREHAKTQANTADYSDLNPT